MKKQTKSLSSVIAILLTVVVLLNALNPMKVSYASTKLTDIDSHWGKAYIQRLVDTKAITGYTDGTFKPDATISRAAFITVLIKAMKLTPSQSNYFSDTQDHWARAYISAAIDAGIITIDDYPEYSSNNKLIDFKFNPDINITREEMAQIITRALGEEYSALSINQSEFSDTSLVKTELIGYVATASNNGIITGYPDGRFAPTSFATRAEACVMITRLLDKLDEKPSLDEMDSEDIYQKYSKAVVMIKGTDEYGDTYELGSGFVIDESGKVVTNYHVINLASNLEVIFSDGTTKKVVSIHNYDRGYDIAVLNLEDGHYDTVPIGNSRRLNIGERVYTLGYPLAMNLSISDGLVSSFINEESGPNYIQISAPISPGSSGGALVDKYGRVVGVTTGGYINAQNINIAIPICDIVNIISGENEEIGVYQATHHARFSKDTSLDGNVENFQIFATEDLDMKEVTYDYLFNINKHDYLGYSLKLSHNPSAKNNSYLCTIMIKDSDGKYVFYDYFVQRIYNGSQTIISGLIDNPDLEGLGEGDYTFVLYFDDELLIEQSFSLTNQTLKHISAKELFKNVNARKAIALAIDKSHIADMRNAISIDYFVPSGFVRDSEGNDFRDKYPEGWNHFDVSKARYYWQKAKDELDFEIVQIEFLTYDGDSSRYFAQYIKEQLEENLPGIKLTVNQQPFKEKLELANKGQFELNYAGWGADYPDPMTFLDLWVSDNRYNEAGYKNTDYDEVIESSKTGQLSTSLDSRWEALQEAEATLIGEDAVLIPLYQNITQYLQHPYIKNIYNHSFGGNYTFKRATTTREDNTIYTSIFTEFISLDVSLITDSQSITVASNIFEGLLTLGENDIVEPGVAESWDKSEDGLTYTFHLRDDAIWSNGTPVTAHDFVYSLQRLGNPETGAQYAFLLESAAIKNGTEVLNGVMQPEELGIKAIDDKTLQFELDAPMPYFEKLMALPVFYPINEEFVNEVGDAYGTTIKTTLFNGPFVLSEWNIGSDFKFKKNELYWDAKNTTVDQVDFKIINNIDIAIDLYESGKIDRIEGFNFSNYPRLLEDPNLHYFEEPVSFYLVFNIDNNG